MRLLVIEDECDLCEDIAKKLRLSGYEADTCVDGEAALELLAVERYDLVLLDLNLPKVDGMTVLRTLREHDQETGVLILSARSEISDKVDGLDAGANDYLSKPFHLEELEARVRSLTRRQPHGHGRRTDAFAHAQGERHSGISAAQPRAAGQSGGAHRARLGQQRGQLQQFHPRTHLYAAEKAARGTGIRPDPQ